MQEYQPRRLNSVMLEIWLITITLIKIQRLYGAFASGALWDWGGANGFDVDTDSTQKAYIPSNYAFIQTGKRHLLHLGKYNYYK